MFRNPSLVALIEMRNNDGNSTFSFYEVCNSYVHMFMYVKIKQVAKL